jgi:hypothetical protein
MSEEVLINVTPQGEAGISRMHLMCIRAAERPAMDGRAGVKPRPVIAPGMAGRNHERFRK